MAAYQLPQHIHYCEIGDERVFLDLARDRYFSLPPAADAAFSALHAAGTDAGATPDQISFLLRSGVLVPSPHGRPLGKTCHPRPTRSLLERETPRSRPSPADLFEAWLLTSRARRAVARKRLPAFLRALTSRRPAIGVVPAGQRAQAIGQFRAARRLVPIAPNCLYDSLALCRFLQRRNIAADLVIGAKLHPFGAHCWLQDGDEVLNDSLAAARDFAPVLVA